MDNVAMSRSAQPHFNPFQQFGQFNPHTQTHTPAHHGSWNLPAPQQIPVASPHYSSQNIDRRIPPAARHVHQHSQMKAHNPQSFRANQMHSQSASVSPFADVPQSSHAFSSQKEQQNIQYFLQGSHGQPRSPRSVAGNDPQPRPASSVSSFSSAPLWMENAWSPFASYNGNAQNSNDHNPQRGDFNEEF